MAKLANNNAVRNSSTGNRGNARRADGFANLVVENSEGQRVSLSRTGTQLYRSDEPSSAMQALHNWILDNPEEAKGLVIRVDSIVNLEERADPNEMDFSSFLSGASKPAKPSSDETTNKLREHFAKA
ncbi:hypothetical protein IT774_07580 [Salinimonas marina]|uniref:Uncharacterized protein n=1 Tax=Salinimonas marina TaxID=2785918 RepID=A0A7S9E0U0_9ALTE|nr:hypothetical protein [Salinimonas marina]QPG06955.1 hypothetical protein IT774_07580 [Salinimonas marina]